MTTVRERAWSKVDWAAIERDMDRHRQWIAHEAEAWATEHKWKVNAECYDHPPRVRVTFTLPIEAFPHRKPAQSDAHFAMPNDDERIAVATFMADLIKGWPLRVKTAWERVALAGGRWGNSKTGEHHQIVFDVRVANYDVYTKEGEQPK